jgi:acyl carrier protein
MSRSPLGLAEQQGKPLPVDRIHGALRLNEDLQLDSLKRIEVVSRISDKYEFEPEIDTIMELRTVDDIIRLMEEHLRGQ